MNKIISFSGGGIAGALSSAILAKIQAAYPSLMANTTFLAGTSTGALEVGALATGSSPQDLVDLYVNKGADCFTSSFWRKSTRFFGLTKSIYDGVGLRKVLTDTFGDIQIKDVPKKILIPTTQVTEPNDPTPVIFTNYTGNPDTTLLVDAVMCSAAAPVYYPMMILNGVGYLDGGLCANLPGELAVGLIGTSGTGLKVSAEKSSRRLITLGSGPSSTNITTTMGSILDSSSYLLLAIGTGQTDINIGKGDTDMGVQDLLTTFVPMFLEAQEATASVELKYFLGNNFCYINPGTKNYAVDDVGSVSELVQQGQNLDISNVLKWLSSVNW